MGLRQKTKQQHGASPKFLDAAKQRAVRAKPLHRGRQVVRQWQILVALRGAHFGLTLKELGQAVGAGCSERTLYRDIEQLQAAGFGVDNTEERIRLRQEIGGMPCTPDDVVALSQVAQALEHTGIVGETLKSLRDRLYSALTERGRQFYTELLATQLFTLPAALPAPMAQLSVIEDAISREHLLSIVYRSPRSGETQRVVRPYATWHASGQSYLIADCRTAKTFRTFHVARVVKAEVLDEAFERDPAFKLSEYTRQAFRVMGGPAVRVVLELSPVVEHLARERMIHPSQVVEVVSGKTRLVLKTGGLPELAAWVAGSGGEIRVLEPEALKALVRGVHERGLGVGE